MDIRKQAEELLSKMTLEEKTGLCAGESFWLSPALERLGLKAHIMTDGPHGLRKQEQGADHLGINQSLPAVCFPTASAVACSFDRELIERMGEALGDKCVREDVAVLLGPGINMKRSPLCGRNFEYFSEDPYLAGELGAAYTKGVQSKGIGVSVKHFAANSQETNRMTVDSVVDLRALHEIYLEAFHRVVEEAKPWTVMCSYNQINGIYANTNHWLLTDMLRDEWHYDGLVVSDWGAVSDRAAGIQAGMDLEMPGVGPDSAAQLMEAVKSGALQEKELDRSVWRIIELILKMQQEKKPSEYSDESDHELAEKIAVQSAVLLKNDDQVLPLDRAMKVAFIGQMAKKPRYQGAGSSKINAYRLENVCQYAQKTGISFTYADGYAEECSQIDAQLLNEAVKTAEDADVAVIFAGLPDAYESEGFDRDTMEMPIGHVQLIEAVAAANPNTVVVLQCGSPVEMPWREHVKGILLMYLGGEAGAEATVKLLFGEENPSGKLAETWPERLSDTPCASCYPGNGRAVWHRESIYIGYRYYDAAGCRPAYPFGYGLSYTDFQYRELQLLQSDVQGEENEYTVTLMVKNTGSVAGRETVQLYLGKKGDSALIRAPKELKGFSKVYLQPGEEKRVTFVFRDADTAYYNAVCGMWCIEEGEYAVQIGASSRDIRLQGVVYIQGDGKEELLREQKQRLVQYREPASPLRIADGQFLELLGFTPTPETQDAVKPYTVNSTFGDIRDTWIGKMLIKKAVSSAPRFGEDPSMQRMVQAMLYSTPIRSLRMIGDMTWTQAQGIAEMANGHYLKGFCMLKGKK
ncbi:MAG: glycoside hydrolase family 3 C-terminal domain-containing protein [bacterium]|nr:glycoside hydrolase family 3 C-terminal domain-containing protein [bacterium]